MKCAGVMNVVVTPALDQRERFTRVPRRQDRRSPREQRRERVTTGAGVVRGPGDDVHVVGRKPHNATSPCCASAIVSGFNPPCTTPFGRSCPTCRR